MDGDRATWGTTHPMTVGVRKDCYCIDDIRAAIDWAFSPGGDPSIGVALTASAVPLWMELSLMIEARERAQRALSSIGEGQDLRLEKRLHAALGTSLFFSRGSSGFESAVTRDLEHADELDETEYQLGALWRHWSYLTVAGGYRSALTLGERFRDVAARAQLPSDQAVGDRLLGITYHFLGEQTQARHHLERMLEGYDPAVSNSHIERFQIGQRSAALAQLARVLWLQGFPDQALTTACQAVEEARRLEHPNTICYALTVAACPVALLAGDLSGAERALTALLDQATRHQMSLWRTWSAGFKGSLCTRRGDLDVGVQLLSDTIIALHEGSYFVPIVGLLGELGMALGRAGRATQGLLAIEQAIERCTHTDERWSLPELLRIKGELILQTGSHEAGLAERLFDESLVLANRQATPSWRLRTAISFANLLQSQGRTRGAYDLLAPIYAWFAEGFDTADLKSAKELLDVLSRH